MSSMREKHPDWLWNRSDTHIILGVPGSLEGFKTPVEPGNSFSPGPGTFGISCWIFDHSSRKLFAPEMMKLPELAWRFYKGYIPILSSTWRASNVRVESRLFTDGDNTISDIKDYLTISLENQGNETVDVSLYLVVRSFGSAGGPIKHIGISENGVDVEINHFPLIYPEEEPTSFGAVSYTDTKMDICQFLIKGKLPKSRSVNDDSTWASGALEYRFNLVSKEKKSLYFVFPVQSNFWMFNWIKHPKRPLKVKDKEKNFITRWQREYISIDLKTPDKRFTEAFYAQLTHQWMATVYNAPRVSPLCYPLWWLRDGVYILNSLDKEGFHEFVEKSCKEIAPRDVFGGFGSEGDGPGQSIWALTEHYLLTRDETYLREIYSSLLRKAKLIVEMRHADRPIKQFTEFCIPQNMLSPATDLMCRPAKEGLIQGRMDSHFPIFWVNGFSYMGLKRVAYCARILGDNEKSEYFETEAEELINAIKHKVPLEFGKNDRDLTSALWPTRWASSKDPKIRKAFDIFWDTVRCPNGKYQPEPLWTYFELGQAHNYLFLGQRERTWVSLNYFLSHHTAPGLYTYHEGNGDENSSGLWQRCRGWDKIKYVTPHGWTSAELFLLLRDCMLYENEGTLVIGAGVPKSWMECKESFGISNVSTYFGKVMWKFDPYSHLLTIEIEHPPDNGCKIALPGITVLKFREGKGNIIKTIQEGLLINSVSSRLVIECK